MDKVKKQSAFEKQRALLLEDVSSSMENVLQNINKLNRHMEGIIAVGHEFGQVESLWSQFEDVMGKEAPATESTQEDTKS